MAKLLSKGFNNSVYALAMGEFHSPSVGEWVGKLFKEEDSYPEWELQALIQMGNVNSLMVKVHEEIVETKKGDLLIMERLYPLQPRALDKEQRLEMLEKFLQQLKELHKSGWAHADLKRPSHCCKGDGDQWDNIIPTIKGIRLIDAGSAIEADDPCFEQEVQKDLADFCEFAKWFTKDAIPEKDIIPLLRKWMGL